MPEVDGLNEKNVPNPQKATSLVPAAHSRSPRVIVPRCPCPDVGALLPAMDSASGCSELTGPGASNRAGLAWGCVGGALGCRLPGEPQQTPPTHIHIDFPRGLGRWDGSRPCLHPPQWFMAQEGVFGTRVQISTCTLIIVAWDIPFKYALCCHVHSFRV